MAEDLRKRRKVGHCSRLIGVLMLLVGVARAQTDVSWPFAGTPLDLSAAGVHFFAASAPAHTASTLGSVLLVPDFGGHPGYPGAQRHLYEFLPKHGWTVLACEPPATLPTPLRSAADWAKAGALLKPRIDACLQWLGGQGLRNNIIIIQGHAGVALLSAYAGHWPDAVRGVALLAPPHLARHDNPMPDEIAQLPLPITLIYAHADLPGSDACQACVDSANQHHVALRRSFLAARDLQFSDLGDELAWLLLDWMKALEGQQIAVPTAEH